MPAPHVAILFDQFGPYHVARLQGASTFLNATGVEIASESSEYDWSRVEDAKTFDRVTLFPDVGTDQLDAVSIANEVIRFLERVHPDTVAIPGWSHPGSIGALQWCMSTDTSVIMMSESTEHDFDRVWWKEFPKRRLLAQCGAALVGGNAHRRYLSRLGMPSERVFLGYDVVDNEHFADGAAYARRNADAMRSKFDLPRHYFLASNRFIPKKNLPFLIEAFAEYRRKASKDEAWDLVLLGDGPERPAIESTIDSLDLDHHVHLPGFRQYDDLPAYYGLAGAFVHVSTREQWGLVVNEAMASGLPALVSTPCGCAEDLIVDGENGYTFDPTHMDALVNHLHQMGHGSYDIAKMGSRSVELIAAWGKKRFGKGIQNATEVAINSTAPKKSFIDNFLMNTLLRR